MATRLTTVFAANGVEHEVPQTRPAGALATAPDPVPPFVTDKLYWGTKSAVTEVSAVRLTVHVPVPAQTAPLHPANADPAAGVAVRVTEVPRLIWAEQVAPQLIPAGELVITPEPEPLMPTERVACAGGGGPKFAVTVLSASSFTLHPPLPLHAPPQPVKTNPVFGATVSAIVDPPTKLVEHAVPQLIPPGLLITVPPLVGLADTLNVCAWAAFDPTTLTGVPEPLLPVSTRDGPVPPHATKVSIKSAAHAARSIDLRPAIRITRSSCGAQKYPRVVALCWRGSDSVPRQGGG